jgi:hypothetical protein
VGRSSEPQNRQKEQKDKLRFLTDSGQKWSLRLELEATSCWLTKKRYKIKQNKDLFTVFRLAETLFEEVK